MVSGNTIFQYRINPAFFLTFLSTSRRMINPVITFCFNLFLKFIRILSNVMKQPAAVSPVSLAEGTCKHSRQICCTFQMLQNRLFPFSIFMCNIFHRMSPFRIHQRSAVNAQISIIYRLILRTIPLLKNATQHGRNMNIRQFLTHMRSLSKWANIR